MAIEDKDAATDLSVAPVVGPDDPRRFTDSGIEVKTLYTSADLPENLRPGQARGVPCTRGVHADMYRKRHVDDAPVRGVRVGEGVQRALQVPAQERVHRADAWPSTCRRSSASTPTIRAASARSGGTGVAIDTLDDMRTAFDGIPLDEVSDLDDRSTRPPRSCCCSTNWSPRSRASSPSELRGTVQNDILKEYIARGNFIYPPEPLDAAHDGPVRLLQGEHPEVEHGLDLRLPLPREGRLGGQEVAFTLASGMAYVQAAIDAGLAVDDFAPRLAFFFNGHNNVFQEVAKFRAARKHVGARDGRPLRRRRTRSRRCCASTRRPAASR